MSHALLGDLLRRTTQLSDMDVEEILQEQQGCARRFGEIAMDLGLCGPQDVWQAWYGQLDAARPRIDLEDFGVDDQAIAMVPAEVARQFKLVPLRAFDNQLVAAVPEDQEPPAAEISRRLRRDVRFVHADARQIQSAIDDHYGETTVDA